MLPFTYLTVLLAACASTPAYSPPPATADSMLDVGSTSLYIRAVGDGIPVVVVHGGPSLEHSYLVEPLRELTTQCRLVFFDQRLSGRSSASAPRSSIRLDTLAEDIDAVRASLGTARVRLVAHSWGALPALRFAQRHPSRVASVVLVSPAPPSAALLQRANLAQAARREPALAEAIRRILSSSGFAEGQPASIDSVFRLSFRGQMALPWLADSLHFALPMDQAERSRRFGAIRTELEGYDLQPMLSAVGAPVLVVYGAAEDLLQETLAAFANHLPNVSFARVDNAGHFAFLENPASFHAIVAPFLGCG